MSQPYYKFSNDPVCLITEDTDAQSIMLQLGVLDKISHKTDLTDTTSVCVVDNHPTHWCLCARIWDNPNPAENVFMVIGFPKATVDRLTVEMQMQSYLAGSTRITPRLRGGPGRN